MSELCLTHLALCYSCENNNSNKNNFILCKQELDSLPVLAGQDIYTNNITITLNYQKALQIATLKKTRFLGFVDSLSGRQKLSVVYFLILQFHYAKLDFPFVQCSLLSCIILKGFRIGRFKIKEEFVN